jgi:hypothetical protein
VFLNLFDHALEVGITGAKATRKPVPAALGNFLAVGKNFELTRLTGRNDSINVQALLDEGRETRDLAVVVLSGRTVNDFDLHLQLPSDSRRTQRRQGWSSYGIVS